MMRSSSVKRLDTHNSETDQTYLSTRPSIRPSSSSRTLESGRVSRISSTRDSFSHIRRVSSYRLNSARPQYTATEPSARHNTQASMTLEPSDDNVNKSIEKTLRASTYHLNLEKLQSSQRNSNSAASSLRKITSYRGKPMKAKDPQLLTTMREENLEQIMNDANINPEKIVTAGSLDDRELALQKQLLKQINDQIHHHLQHQQRREEERTIALKEFEPKVNDRDLLFKKLEIDSKYKALRTKILEKVVDNEFLKMHREDRLARSKKRAAKLSVNIAKIRPEMNDTKMRVVNTDKTAAIYDVRDFHKVSQLIDEKFTGRIVEKVAAIAQKHAIDFSPPVTHKRKTQAPVADATDPNEAVVRRSVPEDPEQEAWDRYLEENFPTLVKDEKTDALRHVCYHPSEYGESYNRYIANKAERAREKLARSQSAAIVRRPDFNEQAVEKPKQPVVVAKKDQSKPQKERFKTEATLRREHVPEVLKTIQKVNKEVEERYQPVYQAVQWNAVHEEVFLENRQESLKSLPIGSFGAANAITMVGFYNNNQVVRTEQDKIDKKQSEAKNSFYFLNNNAFSRKKIQNELDLLIDEEIDKIEFEVANRILEKYYNDQKVVFEERRKYLESVQVQRRLADRKQAKVAQRQATIEEGKRVQKFYTSQVKALLKRREEGLITKADDRFSKSHVIQDCRDSYSKLSNLRKILENLKKKKHILEAMSQKDDNPEEKKQRSASIQPSQRKKGETQTIELRKSLTRSYSGGPFVLYQKAGPNPHSDQQRHEAVTRIQKHVRGVLARKRVQELRDMRAWLSTKFMKNLSGANEMDMELETKETLVDKAARQFTRLAKRPSLIARAVDHFDKKAAVARRMQTIEATHKERSIAEDTKKERRRSFSETNAKIHVPQVLSHFAGPEK